MQVTVNLSRKMYENVKDKVRSGMYSTTNEVIRDALRKMDESQTLDNAWNKLDMILTDAEMSGRSSSTVSDIVQDVLNKKTNG